MAFGLLVNEVPGATPKIPNSGLMAYSLPSLPGRIQAISSPTVSICNEYEMKDREQEKDRAREKGIEETRSRVTNSSYHLLSFS